MNKQIMMFSLCLSLFSSALLAGNFKLQKGDLDDEDRVDLVRIEQKGKCPTKYPQKSLKCQYSSDNITGLEASVLNVIDYFTVEGTYKFSISLSEGTKNKGYPFDEESCNNLQDSIKKGSIVEVNKTGCLVH